MGFLVLVDICSMSSMNSCWVMFVQNHISGTSWQTWVTDASLECSKGIESTGSSETHITSVSSQSERKNCMFPQDSAASFATLLVTEIIQQSKNIFELTQRLWFTWTVWRFALEVWFIVAKKVGPNSELRHREWSCFSVVLRLLAQWVFIPAWWSLHYWTLESGWSLSW